MNSARNNQDGGPAYKTLAAKELRRARRAVKQAHKIQAPKGTR